MKNFIRIFGDLLLVVMVVGVTTLLVSDRASVRFDDEIGRKIGIADHERIDGENERRSAHQFDKIVDEMVKKRAKRMAIARKKAKRVDDQGNLDLHYVDADESKSEYVDAQNMMRENKVFDEIVEAVNKQISLPQDIPIRIGVDGEGQESPHYNPMLGEIIYPWFFVSITDDVLSEAGYEGEELDDATADVTRFVFYHELAHALIHQLKLPVVGKEEDAADSFAVVLAIEFEGKGEMAIAAADMFGAFHDMSGPPDVEAYSDSHSLDLQRFYTIGCLTFGADTKEYADVADRMELSEERREMCEMEYEQARTSWFGLLDKALKDGAADE